jgi:hypothetical protein
VLGNGFFFCIIFERNFLPLHVAKIKVKYVAWLHDDGKLLPNLDDVPVNSKHWPKRAFSFLLLAWRLATVGASDIFKFFS